MSGSIKEEHEEKVRAWGTRTEKQVCPTRSVENLSWLATYGMEVHKWDAFCSLHDCSLSARFNSLWLQPVVFLSDRMGKQFLETSSRRNNIQSFSMVGVKQCFACQHAWAQSDFKQTLDSSSFSQFRLSLRIYGVNRKEADRLNWIAPLTLVLFRSWN